MADYADINITSTVWASGPTLSDDVVVQAGGEPVAITTKSTPGVSKGLTLAPGEKVMVSSGKTLKYRAIGPRGGTLRIEAL